MSDERPILKKIREEDDKLKKLIHQKGQAHQRHWVEIDREIKAQKAVVSRLIAKFNEQDETK